MFGSKSLANKTEAMHKSSQEIVFVVVPLAWCDTQIACLPACPSVCLPACLPICLSVYLPACLPVPFFLLALPVAQRLHC